MRHLYLRIYLTIILILVVFAGLMSVTWWLTTDREKDLASGLGALLGHALPAAGEPPARLRAVLDELAGHFGADVTVRGPDARLIAAAGEPLALAPGRERGLHRGFRRGLSLTLRLADGRWVIARHRHARGHRLGWLWGMALLAMLVAIGVHPIARRLTRRLERLRARVEQLGSGDLSVRVEVQGRDEVSDLARSFNRAAARIEHLVGAQRAMLASASHELRTPLTRIRMAIELLGVDARPELEARVARDIEELDDLIDELLLSSRLQALGAGDRLEELDLLALMAEEGARVGATVDGTPLRLRANGRLLRRLARNLFENARRHGAGTPIEVLVESLPDGAARLSVSDRGPGVPDDERARIFEPFYRPPGARETGEGGVGLGLALVRQIAESHGGGVRCVARDGGGTRFEVTLYPAESR